MNINCQCCKPDVVIEELPKDIMSTWGVQQFKPTNEIIEDLVHHRPDLWGSSTCNRKEITAQKIGRVLVNEYGIFSSRPGGRGPRGYCISQFAEAGLYNQRDTPNK